MATEDTTVAIIGEKVANLEKRFDTWEQRIFQQIDSLLNAEVRIEQKLQELGTKVAERRECPAPGLCIGLEKRLDKLQSEVESLLGWRWYLIGSMAVLTIVGTLVVTVFTPWIQSHIGP